MRTKIFSDREIMSVQISLLIGYNSILKVKVKISAACLDKG